MPYTYLQRYCQREALLNYISDVSVLPLDDVWDELEAGAKDERHCDEYASMYFGGSVTMHELSVDFSMYTLHEEVTREYNARLETVYHMLDMAKAGIVAETIAGTLDSDMNELDMVALIDAGVEAEAQKA